MTNLVSKNRLAIPHFIGLKLPFFNQKVRANLCDWLIVIQCFGYPAQVMIPLNLGINTTTFNFTARIIYASISLLLIVFSPISIRKTTLGFLSFSLFWFIYGLRLIYDLEIIGVQFLETSSFYVYSFGFGCSLLSSMAVFSTGATINLPQSLFRTYLVLLVSALLMLLFLFTSSTVSLATFFLQRTSVMTDTQDGLSVVINAITISFTGTQLALLSLYYLLFKPFQNKKILFWVFILSALVGVGLVMLGASRGPLLTLFLLVMLMLWLKLRSNASSLRFFLKLSVGIALLFVVFVVFIQPMNQDNDVEIVSRLTAFADERANNVKEERDYEWASAWQQFLSNPVLGDKFVTDYDKSYAHNIVLDVMMSTGITGLFVFLLFFYSISRKIWFFFQHFDSFPLILPFLFCFFSILLISLTSGGVFINVSLWIYSAFLSVISFANASILSNK